MMLPEGYRQHREAFADILDARKYTISWLDNQVFSGAIRVLATDSAAILFKFERYPTGWLELQGMAAAGDLANIKDVLIPAAEKLAREMLCGTAQIASTAAWSRILRDAGYTEYQRTIEKVL